MGPEWTVPVPVWSGRRPVVSSGFRTRDRPRHDGVDIDWLAIPSDPPWSGRDSRLRTRKHVAFENVPIVCAAPGTVWKLWRQSNGVWVRVAHDGGRWNTTYGHLAIPLVVAGQELAAGAPIGIMGPDQSVPGFVHLHFELFTGAWGHVDPCLYLPNWRALAVNQEGKLVPLPFA